MYLLTKNAIVYADWILNVSADRSPGAFAYRNVGSACRNCSFSPGGNGDTSACYWCVFTGRLKC